MGLAPIVSDRQIYVVDASGNHWLGRFDKVTWRNNQTWAFNYKTPPETFTNMPSLKNVVNVWENQSLTLQQVYDQVSAFIISSLQ